MSSLSGGILPDNYEDDYCMAEEVCYHRLTSHHIIWSHASIDM